MRRITPRTRRRALQFAPLVVIAALVGIAVGEAVGGGDRKPRPRDRLAGSVAIDGTVALLGMTESAARTFERRHPGVRVTVGASRRPERDRQLLRRRGGHRGGRAPLPPGRAP